MTIDWITWSIWFLGLVILVVWIYVPIKEFKTLLEKHRQKSSHTRPKASPPDTDT